MTALPDLPPLPTRVVIYGAGGFIGAHLTDDLLRKGHQVRAFIRSRSKAPWLQAMGAEVMVGDIRDPDQVRSAAEGCDLAFNLVSNRFQEDSRLVAYRGINVGGVENVVRAAAESGMRRLVHASSVHVYGRLSDQPATEETPVSPTLCHDQYKLEAERVACERGAEFGLSVVVARLPLVLGAGQGRVRKTFHQVVEEGMFVRYGGRDPWRNIAHVDDAVAGLERCAAVGAPTPRLYLLPGHNTTLEDFLSLIADEAGVTLHIKRRPIWPAEVMSHVCGQVLRLFGRECRLAYGVEFFVRDHKLDGTKAKRELGYAPSVSLRDTIADMIAWYRRSGYAEGNEGHLAQLAENAR